MRTRRGRSRRRRSSSCAGRAGRRWGLRGTCPGGTLWGGGVIIVASKFVGSYHELFYQVFYTKHPPIRTSTQSSTGSITHAQTHAYTPLNQPITPGTHALQTPLFSTTIWCAAHPDPVPGHVQAHSHPDPAPPHPQPHPDTQPRSRPTARCGDTSSRRCPAPRCDPRRT